MLKTNLTPVLNTQRSDKYGQYPLRIRATIQRKVTYHPTGIVLLTKQLVVTKVKVKVRGKEIEKVVKIEIDHHPNKELLNRILREKINTLERGFMESEILGDTGMKLKKGSTIKFSDYAKEFLKKEKRDKSNSTYKISNTGINKFNEFKPNIKLKDITPETLLDFEHYCKKKFKNIDNTVWTATKFMKKILIAAQKEGYILKTPGEGFIGVKYIDPLRETMSLDEIAKLEGFVSNPLQPKNLVNVGNWFLFSCYTALRFGDMTRFKGIKDGKVLLQVEKTKEIVSFSATPNIIKAHERINDTILTNQKTNLLLKSLIGSLGIDKKITFHNARHTFAVTYLRKGGRLEYLQKLMGHKKIATTAIYAKISNMDANEELQRIWGS